MQIIFLIGIFFIVFNICNRLYHAWKMSSSRVPVIEQVQEETGADLEENNENKEQQLKNLESKARQQIAVSGEKIKIKKKDGYDVFSAESVLRKAKDSFEVPDFESALMYAKEASEVVDTAEKIVKPVKTYIVQSGDCLWYISKKYFKRGSNWYDIWQANKEKIPDFDLIYRNQNIIIPTLQKNS
ncbi:MAG: hypothetical protein A2539_02700 [Elusimicrobia bacterium RIFOXYD2_FULL_34_15]|nr:MAG: hypothetical protein A2539_02700 [Elusimicrobia bacterium RIFOXYD2_FULL_34_15]